MLLQYSIKNYLKSTNLRQLRHICTNIETQLDLCKRFFHWESLFVSIEKDLEKLRARQKELELKSHVNV